MSCNTGNLSTYTPTTANPWDKKKIQHFYRRLGFGATNEFITEALNLFLDFFVIKYAI